MLCVPNKSEQKQIVFLLDELQYDVELSQEYLLKLNAKKKGLMQNLLTGKVRVTELLKDVETASP
jgi:type I restriction enzyme S subunit